MRRRSEAEGPRRVHIPLWLGACLFLAIAIFFLWAEHRAHMLGALPYLLLLSCPVIHLLMHRGHGRHAGPGTPEGAGPHTGANGRVS